MDIQYTIFSIQANNRSALTPTILTGTSPRRLNVTTSSLVLNEDIYWLIDRLADDSRSFFRFCHFTFQEVFREIKGQRLDSSTGPDNIPAMFVTLLAEHLVSPRTHILRWMSHGQITITDPSLFYLYHLRFMRNWLSNSSVYIGSVTPLQPRRWR